MYLQSGAADARSGSKADFSERPVLAQSGRSQNDDYGTTGHGATREKQ
jgi:hypothetical protein